MFTSFIWKTYSLFKICVTKIDKITEFIEDHQILKDLRAKSRKLVENDEVYLVQQLKKLELEEEERKKERKRLK